MNIMDKFEAWLLENSFPPDQPLAANAQGEQPLILAARQARNDVLSHLLQLDADLTALDPYGNNALWAACFAEAADCINLLLQAGIDIDYQNPSGATALIYASSSGRHAVVDQLLKAGANPQLATLDDFSALDLAANRQCLQLLRGVAKAVG